MIDDDEMYKLKFVAAVLKVSVVTLRGWDKKGFFKARRTIGNHMRYSGKDIKDLMEKMKAKKTEQVATS